MKAHRAELLAQAVEIVALQQGVPRKEYLMQCHRNVQSKLSYVHAIYALTSEKFLTKRWDGTPEECGPPKFYSRFGKGASKKRKHDERSLHRS
jgi:hypothetical protein